MHWTGGGRGTWARSPRQPSSYRWTGGELPHLLLSADSKFVRHNMRFICVYIYMPYFSWLFGNKNLWMAALMCDRFQHFQNPH